MIKAATALTCVLTSLVLSLVGCKARQPDEAGLLSAAGNQDSEQISSEGNYQIRCASDESGGSNDSYVFEVNGAVDTADEAQPIRVNVDILQNGTTKRVVSGAQGRGAVAPGKSIFVGVENGVLTGESDSAANMVGVVSIVGHAEGLQVRCDVASVKLDQE